MLASIDVLDANELLYLGKFKGEFIRIKYDSDLFEYQMSLAYMADRGFHNCKTY